MAAPSHNWAGLWQHPRDNQTEYNQLHYWIDLAKTAERGLLDCIFIADVFGVYDLYANSPDAALASAAQIPQCDPAFMLPIMASVTRNICFGLTANINVEHPYSFVRKISTLDHVTNGRLAWNIVTGYLNSGAKALGQTEIMEHDYRYEKAEEYMTVFYKLLEESWKTDAVNQIKDNGYVDPQKVKKVSFQGKYYKTEGIALTEPSPQRVPVLFQAGSSDKGRAFAGKHAEATFINAPSLEIAKKKVKQIRSSAIEHNRFPEDIKVLVSATVIVAETNERAKELLKEYESYILDKGQLALVSGWIGKDLSHYDHEDKLEFFKTNAIQTTLENLTHANTQSAKILDLMKISPFGSRSPVFVGDAKTIALEMEKWLVEADIDGFNLVRTVMPESLDRVVDLLIPELQNRGIFKKSYKEGTLRQKLSNETFAQPWLSKRHIGASFRYE